MYSHNDPNSQFSITIYSITHNTFFHFTRFFIFIAHQISHQIGRIQLIKPMKCGADSKGPFTLSFLFYHYHPIAIPFQCLISFERSSTHNYLSTAHTVFQ